MLITLCYKKFKDFVNEKIKEIFIGFEPVDIKLRNQYIGSFHFYAPIHSLMMHLPSLQIHYQEKFFYI